MITIGICDDDSEAASRLYNIIEHIMFPVSEWEYRYYQSSEAVIHEIEAGTFHCRLVFMDIMMNKGSGLDTAKYICSHCPETDLIFVTGSSEHVYECYHYHAYAYLLKPVSEQDIQKELLRYLDDILLPDKTLTISFQGTTRRIPVSSILYIESNLRKITVHTEQDDYLCYRKLDEIDEALRADGFLRCHQSYLVSRKKITAYTNSYIYIQDIRIPISSRYQAECKKLLTKDFHHENKSRPVSLGIQRKNYGALICTHGTYLGSMIRFRPEQKIRIGRDGQTSDLIINLPLVSRNHCSILYQCSRMEYEVTDYSNNGTFVNDNKRLLPNETYVLKPGCKICFGDKENIYWLG